MRKRLSRCFTGSARHKPLSSGWGRAVTGGRVWRARARAYVNVSDGEERSSAKSVGRYRKSKIVRLPYFPLYPLSDYPSYIRHAAGLTDYEVRDLNDEINRLLREKRHWENQIVALGGANYRRNVAMLDDDGKEVPGTKGYKYFGRAKELPGVKELFVSKKTEEDEENKVQNYYKKFMSQGPAYFGDLDETDGKLLEFEMHAEEEGTCPLLLNALLLRGHSTDRIPLS